MRILTLEELGIRKFLRLLDECSELDNGKNPDWFDKTRPWSLYHRYRLYSNWTLLFDDTEFIAMSCIQTYGFPPKVARVLTRTFYNPKYRRIHLQYESNKKTPAMLMLEKQLEVLHDYDHIFFSVEFLYRRPTIVQLAQKLNHFYNHNWIVLDGLYQTYKEDKPGAWQSCCVMSRVESSFPLDHITYYVLE